MINRYEVDFIIVCTSRAIIHQNVIDRLKGRVFNIHPNGIPSYKNGTMILQWPQPLFAGKRAMEMMWELSQRFAKGESRLDCRYMEWVLHRIAAPPLVDAGEFIISSRLIPVPTPSPDDAQARCAAHLRLFINDAVNYVLFNQGWPWPGNPDPRITSCKPQCIVAA